MDSDRTSKYVGSRLTDPTDQELLAAWRAGDQSAMRAVVSRYLEAVRGPLSWLIEDTAECDEAVAEVFASLAERDEIEFPAFSLRIALTRRAVALGEEWRRAHAAARTQQAQALRDQGRVGKPGPQEVVAGLAELPTDFFVPLMLRHLENRSIAEIGEVLEKGEKQVWATIHQALASADRSIRGAVAGTPRMNSATCDPVAILMLLEDELPAKERVALARHVEGCTECRSQEWRLSTLLAFLGTIAGMKRKKQQSGNTWERVLARTGKRTSRVRFSRLTQRAAVAVGVLGAVSLLVFVAAYAALNWPAAGTAPPPVVPDDPGPEAVQTVQMAEAAPARVNEEDAWLELPGFSGLVGRGGTPELKVATPMSVVDRDAITSGAEAPEQAVRIVQTTTPEPAAPTAAAEPGSPTPQPQALARNPEPEATGMMAEPVEEQPDPGPGIRPPRPRFEGPVLPSIIRGSDRVGDRARPEQPEPAEQPTEDQGANAIADILGMAFQAADDAITD